MRRNCQKKKRNKTADCYTAIQNLFVNETFQFIFSAERKQIVVKVTPSPFEDLQGMQNPAETLVKEDNDVNNSCSATYRIIPPKEDSAKTTIRPAASGKLQTHVAFYLVVNIQYRCQSILGLFDNFRDKLSNKNIL